MRPRVSFHRLAEGEFLEAIEYYKTIGNDLAKDFIAEIAHGLDSILDHPESAPCVGKKVRRKQIRRFPYVLLYSVRSEGIRILAVMNQKRRPFYWRGRT